MAVLDIPVWTVKRPGWNRLFLQYPGSRSVTVSLQLKQSDGTIIDHVTYSHLFAPEDTWGSRPFAERRLCWAAMEQMTSWSPGLCNFRKVDRSTTKRDRMTLWKIPQFRIWLVLENRFAS